MKTKRLTRRLLTALTAACLLLPGATLAHADEKASGTEAAPAETAPAEAATAEGSLSWGIRASFNNYTGGAAFIQDGATRGENDPDFHFPLKSYSYDAKNEHAEAQFTGKVWYRNYCGKEKNTNLSATCALDLKFQNPKVVLDRNGSYIEATVSSKQYPGGSVFAPGEPVKIATLATSGGTFSKRDGHISWNKIPTQLTPNGVKMFSNFYNVGEGLDPLSFTAKGEGAPLSTDTIKLATRPNLWMADHDDVSYDQYHRVYQADENNLLISVGGAGLYLVDANLTDIAHSELALSRHGYGDYDAANRYYYYTISPDKYSNRLDNEVFRIKVNSDGFGEPEKLGEVPGLIHGIAVQKTTGAIVVLSIADKAKVETEKDYLTKINDGTLSDPILLPSAEELWGEQLTGGSLYAADFMLEPDTSNFLSMDDGTFVLLSNGQPYVPEFSTDAPRKYGLSIDPSKTEPSEIVKLMNKPTDESNEFMPAAATNGTDIVRWNNSNFPKANEIEYLKYANRTLTSVTGTKRPTDLLGIAGAAWDKDGNLVLLDGNKGRLVWVNPDTMEPVQENGKTKEYFIPNGRETNNKAQGNFLALSDGSYYVPTLNEQTGDYIEHYQLVALYDPTVPDLEPPTVSVAPAEVTLENGATAPTDDELRQGVTATDVNAAGKTVILSSTDISIGKQIFFVSVDAEEGTTPTPVSAIDTSKPGKYTVGYTAMDAAGNVSERVTRVYTVTAPPDTIKPVITIAQGKESVNRTYEDRNLTNEELLDGVNATDQVIADGKAKEIKATVKSISYKATPGSESETVEAVDLRKSGTYTVIYEATDEANNVSEPVSREFTVEKDTEKPSITIPAGKQTITLEYADRKLTNEELIDGIIAKDQTIANGEEKNITGVKVLSITYYEEVSQPETPPVATMLFTAITPKITKGKKVDAVDLGTPGLYKVEYQVTDGSGNVSDPASRNFIVKGEAIKPVVTIADDKKSVELEKADGKLTEDQLLDGVSATDKKTADGEAKEIKAKVKSISYKANAKAEEKAVDAVDLSKVGIYTVTYEATDEANNVSEPVSREFTVKEKADATEKPDTGKPDTGKPDKGDKGDKGGKADSSAKDTIKPVVTIIEEKKKLTLKKSDAVLTEEQLLDGVKATDKKTADGEAKEIKAKVKSISYKANEKAEEKAVQAVDLNKLGIYTVTYEATDEAGNVSDPVSRELIVKEKVAKQDSKKQDSKKQDSKNTRKNGKTLAHTGATIGFALLASILLAGGGVALVGTSRRRYQR